MRQREGPHGVPRGEDDGFGRRGSRELGFEISSLHNDLIHVPGSFFSKKGTFGSVGGWVANTEHETSQRHDHTSAWVNIISV